MRHFQLTLSVLTAIFPGEPGLASFIEAKDDGSGGDHWSYKVVQSFSQIVTNNKHFTGQMPFLSPNQHQQSTIGKFQLTD